MRTILIPALLLLLSACDQKAGDTNTPPPPSTEVVTITTSDATTDKDYTASLEGKSNVEIRPQVDGFLEKVYVDEGDHVQAGQPLFKINDQPYRAQLNSAVASLHAAEAAVANAQLEIDKLQPLVDNKVVSDIQMKAAKAAYRMATANAEQARAVISAAKINMGYTLIKAPVSGYVGRLPKKTGSLVGRTDPQPLTMVSDVHEVYAYFSLGETDFIDFQAQNPGSTIEDKIKNLAPVSLVLADNTVYPLQGKVDIVDGQFDKNTGAITLRAVFPNAKGMLRSGNTGKIRLSRQYDNVVKVPQTATIEMQDKVFVYTVGDSNKISKQPIGIVGKTGDAYLVKEGVASGDRIVLNGLDHLQEGAIIQPVAPKNNEQLSMKN